MTVHTWKRLYDLYVQLHEFNQGNYLRDRLSPPLQKRFDAMLKSAERRGTVAATMAKMREKEARKWLNELGAVLSEVRRRMQVESKEVD